MIALKDIIGRVIDDTAHYAFTDVIYHGEVIESVIDNIRWEVKGEVETVGAEVDEAVFDTSNVVR